MKLVIGADHAGVDLKALIIQRLLEAGHLVEDVGTTGFASVDYPVFGEKVARLVRDGHAERGIVICGTGVGISITANKIPGVRAAVCHDAFSARAAVQHNDLNVLALGARVIGPELAWDVVQSWLSARFEGGRHQRRVDMITALESSP